MVPEEAIMSRATTQDPLTRAHSLLAWSRSRPMPEYAAARVGAAREILTVAEQCGVDELTAPAQVLLLGGLLELGAIRSLDRELLGRSAAHQSDRGPDPAAWFGCLRSILDGDAAAAERQADRIYARSQQAGDDGALALYTAHLGMIRWMQGRIDGAEDRFLAARRAYPEQLLWPASLAWLWLGQGRSAAAESLLRSLPPLEALPRDRFWLSTVTVLAEIAVVHGSTANAARLQQILEPHAAHVVPVGVGVAFWGTAARTLGLLEERLGMLDAARTHLESAVEISGRLGALAWQTEAQIDVAEFAIRHDLVDVRAYELLAEARATCAARGFAGLARRAMSRPRIRVLGGFEVIALTGVRAEWSSRKARELLKMLVAARGVATSREVFMDTLWPGEAPRVLGNRFSVAVNVIRRALDPDRLLPTQHHLVTEGDALRLDLDHLDIDVERFLRLAAGRDPAVRRAARELYTGDAFSDEPYADWAVTLRDHARLLHAGLADG